MYWRPLVPNAMTSYLRTQCARHLPCCEGKSIGCSLLRKIVISWMKRNEMTWEQKDSVAKNIMHSADEQERYRKNVI